MVSRKQADLSKKVARMQGKIDLLDMDIAG
jgi:hypothetical protein